jgi:hypothetical protein
MSSPTIIELKNIDSGDLDDVLKKIEKSFDFQFGKTELKDVQTFGELCNIITNKVQGDTINDCTTQQAFYKVRKSIATTLEIVDKPLTVDTKLQDLFPRKERRKQIKAFETNLGMKVKVLRPKHRITTSLFLLLISSFVGLFFYWQVGLSGLIFSFAGLRISESFGKELDLKTIGQLSGKISREHYKKGRRNPTTINRNEIAQKIKELFMIDLDLEKEMTREATFK